MGTEKRTERMQLFVFISGCRAPIVKHAIIWGNFDLALSIQLLTSDHFIPLFNSLL